MSRENEMKIVNKSMLVMRTERKSIVPFTSLVVAWKSENLSVGRGLVALSYLDFCNTEKNKEIYEMVQLSDFEINREL